MKKILCLVLAVMMLIASTTALAAVDTFDKSKLTGSDLYHYDKFSKEWNIQGSYFKEYIDARIRVSLLLFDDYVEAGFGPELRVEVFDKENQCYDQVTAIRILVGEKMFSFENLLPMTNNSCALGGTVMEELCNALIAGGEVAIQIDRTDKFGDSWTSTIDPVSRTDLTDLIAMSKLLRDSKAWSVVSDRELNDIIYGATME